MVSVIEEDGMIETDVYGSLLTSFVLNARLFVYCNLHLCSIQVLQKTLKTILSDVWVEEQANCFIDKDGSDAITAPLVGPSGIAKTSVWKSLQNTPPITFYFVLHHV